MSVIDIFERLGSGRLSRARRQVFRLAFLCAVLHRAAEEASAQQVEAAGARRALPALSVTSFHQRIETAPMRLEKDSTAASKHRAMFIVAGALAGGVSGRLIGGRLAPRAACNFDCAVIGNSVPATILISTGVGAVLGGYLGWVVSKKWF